MTQKQEVEVLISDLDYTQETEFLEKQEKEEAEAAKHD